MPFDFLRRKKEPASTGAAPAAVVGAAEQGIPFDGFTEDWHLVGRMLVKSRLSDALNKRDPLDILDVRWAPIDGSAPLVPAPGLKSVDPYDLILVLTGDDSLPESATTSEPRTVSTRSATRWRSRCRRTA